MAETHLLAQLIRASKIKILVAKMTDEMLR
jgi:hypothetical protein